MFCTRCGTQNAENAQFCRACGAAFSQPAFEPGVARPSPPVFHYAGFWLRFWAYVIDLMVLAAVPVLAAIIIVPLFFTAGVGAAAFGIAFLLVPMALAGGWLYFALMESSSYQATLGKQALSIKVVDMDGQRISFSRATGRYFGKILSGMLLDIGYIMAAFTEKKQALHDILASCLVIRR